MASCRFILYVFICLILFFDGKLSKQLTEKDLLRYRDRVARMFQHAYNGYLNYAYPLDELRPLTCDGHDTWGSYSLTLIDALDTLAIMGNYSEFQRVAKLLEKTLDFDRDINVSVFETNIRVVGGLLSGHLLSRQAGIELDPGWPCSGPLLRLAEQVARKLLPAFNTSTGMPYGTINLLYGIPKGETPVTCTAGVGTFIVEFGALTQLTGLPIFRDTAIKALHSLWTLKSPIGLVGNHIDVLTGKWTALDSGIGAGVDSYFEYLVKGAILFPYPELMEMFQTYKQALTKYLKREDWYMWAHMDKGTITLPIFQSLEAFWPGLLSLTGDIDSAMKTVHNYHQIWRQYGFVPEFYNIPKAEAQVNREGYPLRPELVESVMYLYQATKDPFLLEVAVDILESIEHSTRTPCGYATVKNVKDHQLENRMESFFLAETTKYLYLIFDTENLIHNTGGHGSVITTPGGQCVINAGGYVFNTEAHPVDVAALYCCSSEKRQHTEDVENILSHVDLLRLMGVREETENVIHRKKKKKKKEMENQQKQPEREEENDSEWGSPGNEKVAMENKEKMIDSGKTLDAKDSSVDPQNSSNTDFNSTEGTSASSYDAQPPSGSGLTSHPEQSQSPPCDATTEQPGAPVRVLPPDSGSPQSPSSGNPPQEAPSLAPVTLVPPDLWTLRTSVNNRTEQERVGRLFTCPMRPFHARWSLMGEMFIDE